MVQIATHLRPRGWKPRPLSKKSLVIPDQTLSLKVMVQKYVRGLPIAAPQLDGIGTEEELAIDFKKLDLAEQEEHILRAQEELKMYDDAKTQQLAKNAAEAKKRAESDQKELEELRELKKAQKQ